MPSPQLSIVCEYQEKCACELWLQSLYNNGLKMRDEFEQTLGVGDGQGGLACCGPWGLKESDTTERLN